MGRRVVPDPRACWVNIIARNPLTGEEWTVWNGIVSAPAVLIDVRPEWFQPEERSGRK